MSTLVADIIGLIGSALFIGAFAYANWAKSLNKLVFNLANLAGAILLLISLSVSFNLAAFVLVGADRAVRHRRGVAPAQSCETIIAVGKG